MITAQLKLDAMHATMLLIRDAIRKGRIDTDKLADPEEDIKDIVSDIFVSDVLPILDQYDEERESKLVTFLRTRVNSRLDRTARPYLNHGMTNTGPVIVGHDTLPDGDSASQADGDWSDDVATTELAYPEPPEGYREGHDEIVAETETERRRYKLESVMEALERLPREVAEQVGLYVAGAASWEDSRAAIRRLRIELRQLVSQMRRED